MGEETLKKSYNFPSGEPDLERLQIVHRLFSLLLDGLYPAEIENDVQRLMEQHEPEILDVGCGAGPTWSVQTAERFPNAKVVGLDYAPLYEGWNYPPNFSFRRHDLVSGLPPDYRGKFSLIQCRFCCMHMPDPPMLVDSLFQSLKPGGILLLADVDHTLLGEDTKPMELHKYNPSLSMQDNLNNPRGLSWHAAFSWQIGRAIYSPKYEPPSNLIGKTPLSIILEKEFLVPFGWEGGEIKHEKELVKLYKDVWQHIYDFSAPILAKLTDLPEEFRKALLSRGAAELELDSQRTGMRFWYTVAKKIGDTL